MAGGKRTDFCGWPKRRGRVLVAAWQLNQKVRPLPRAMRVSRFILVFLVVLAVALASRFLYPFGRLFYDETASLVTQAQLHEQAFQNVVRPVEAWVRAFRDRERRLPSESEFTSYARQQFPSLSIGVYDS